jgi:hypothetical protein
MGNPSKKPSGKRSLFLINPAFQYRFMAWVGGLGVSVVMLMHLSHSWFFYQLRKQAVQAGVPPDHAFFRFISERQDEMTWIALACFFGILVISTAFGLVLSHRIAGPMYRLKRHFETVAKTGVHAPLKFRDDDFFLEIPEAYNLQFKDQENREKKAG